MCLTAFVLPHLMYMSLCASALVLAVAQCSKKSKNKPSPTPLTPYQPKYGAAKEQPPQMETPPIDDVAATNKDAAATGGAATAGTKDDAATKSGHSEGKAPPAGWNPKGAAGGLTPVNPGTGAITTEIEPKRGGIKSTAHVVESERKPEDTTQVLGSSIDDEDDTSKQQEKSTQRDITIRAEDEPDIKRPESSPFESKKDDSSSWDEGRV